MPKRFQDWPDTDEKFEEMLDPRAFADNFDRILGLHRLTAAEASKLLGVSKTTISYWRNGHRPPNMQSLAKLESLFEIGMFRLCFHPFTSLLQADLQDVDRFVRVEQKLEKAGLQRQVRFERTEHGVEETVVPLRR